MNSSEQHSPQNGSPQIVQNLSPDDRLSIKRRRAADQPIMPFKKARHASQIKNYEFTMARMRERVMQQERERAEAASRRGDLIYPSNFDAISPNRSYDHFMSREQLALFQAQSRQLSPPTNLGDIGSIQQQQIDIVRPTIPTEPMNMSQFMESEHLIHQAYPANQFGVLQWHTSQLAKSFMAPNAVNRMLEHLVSSREEEQMNRSCGDSETVVQDQEVRNADMHQRDPPVANHIYDNLECGSTSDECESSEESDEAQGEEFYVDPAVRLQMCDNSFSFHQQLALAQMHTIRMQAAKVSAEMHQATREPVYRDDKNAQDFCDDGCDRKHENISRETLDEQVVDDKKIYCSVKCDCDCACKLPSPIGKDEKASSETVIKGKVESVVDNNSKTNPKFTTSPIKNLTLPMNTDYPKA